MTEELPTRRCGVYRGQPPATWQGMQYSIMAICLEQSCRTGEVGHGISETTLPSQGLSASLALVGQEKRQENAD